MAAIVLVLLIGAVLRSVQYGAMASLSSDEVALALNVVDRGWGALLFQPLVHFQVAPLGFLALEKLAVTILGNAEAAFRLVPYLLSLVSLILFWRVAARYLGSVSLVAALVVFALSPSLVFYAGAAKQYSADIVVTLLLIWIALRWLETPVSPVTGAVFGVLGGVAILLSQAAVLVAFGLGALLVVECRRKRAPAGPLLAICAGWFVGAAVLTYTSIATLSEETSAYMKRFWILDFPPPPWEGLGELLWIPARLAESVTYLVAYVNSPSSVPEIGLAAIYGILLLLGILHLAKRNPRTAMVLAVPVVMAVVAAFVELLPLSGRLSLFIGPSLLIGGFAGFDRLRAWLPAGLAPLVHAAALGLAILPGLALLFLTPPPRVLGGTLPVFRDVRAHWRPEDRLVVSRGLWARISAEYYGRRFGMEGWYHLDRLRGGSYTAEDILRGYLREIDAYRGAPRAWFYLDGTVACEEEAMLGYLTAIGRPLHSVVEPVGKDAVSAHLYDLSDPARLRNADADTYPVPVCRD